MWFIHKCLWCSCTNSGETNLVSSQGGENDVIVWKAQKASIRKQNSGNTYIGVAWVWGGPRLAMLLFLVKMEWESEREGLTDIWAEMTGIVRVIDIQVVGVCAARRVITEMIMMGCSLSLVWASLKRTAIWIMNQTQALKSQSITFTARAAGWFLKFRSSSCFKFEVVWEITSC